MSEGKIILLAVLIFIFIKYNEILTLIEKISKGDIKEHSELKKISTIAIERKNFLKQSEIKAIADSKKNIKRIANNLDKLSNTEIKNNRIKSEINNLKIITCSIKEQEEIINRRFRNLVEALPNETIVSFFKKKQ